MVNIYTGWFFRSDMNEHGRYPFVEVHLPFRMLIGKVYMTSSRYGPLANLEIRIKDESLTSIEPTDTALTLSQIRMDGTYGPLCGNSDENDSGTGVCIGCKYALKGRYVVVQRYADWATDSYELDITEISVNPLDEALDCPDIPWLEGGSDPANHFNLPAFRDYTPCQCVEKCQQLGFGGAVAPERMGTTCSCENLSTTGDPFDIDSSALLRTTRFTGLMGWARGYALGSRETQLNGEGWTPNTCFDACLTKGFNGASMLAGLNTGPCFCMAQMTGRNSNPMWISRYLGRYIHGEGWYPGMAKAESTRFLGAMSRNDCIDNCLFFNANGVSHETSLGDKGRCYCEFGWENYYPTTGWETRIIDNSYFSTEVPQEE